MIYLACIEMPGTKADTRFFADAYYGNVRNEIDNEIVSCVEWADKNDALVRVTLFRKGLGLGEHNTQVIEYRNGVKKDEFLTSACSFECARHNACEVCIDDKVEAHYDSMHDDYYGC